MHIDERCLCPTRCLQIQRQGKCGRAKRLNTLHCITNRAETRPLLHACMHARIQTRSVGNAANACPPNWLSLSLSHTHTNARTFSLLSFFPSFSFALSFTSMHQLPAFLNSYATPQNRIKSDSFDSAYVFVARSFRERDDK